MSLFDDNHVVLCEDGTASEKPSSEYDYATAYANVVDITYLVRIHYERQMFILIKVSHSIIHLHTQPDYIFPFNSPFSSFLASFVSLFDDIIR